MDFFGAAEDSDHETDTIDEVITTAVFIECMKIRVCISSFTYHSYNSPFLINHLYTSLTYKPFHKREKQEKPTLEPITFHRRVGLFGNHLDDCPSLVHRLRQTFQDVSIILPSQSPCHEFDVVIDLSIQDGGDSIAIDSTWLTSGGHYIFRSASKGFNLKTRFDDEYWLTDKATQRSLFGGEEILVVIQRRGVLTNPLGAIYWTEQGNFFNPITEKSNIEDVTVSVSVAEKRSGMFSDSSHARAVASLSNHGLVIFPGLFSPDEVMRWGDAAMADMKVSPLRHHHLTAITLHSPYHIYCHIYPQAMISPPSLYSTLNL